MIDRNFWHLTSQDRLAEWRHFRKSLDLKSKEDCLNDCVALWSTAPFVNRYLHPQDISNWPDPWQLLDDNHFCDCAIALGMFYTLALTSHDFDLSLIHGEMDGDEINYVLVNDQNVLNLYHGKVVLKKDWQDQIKIKYEFTRQDFKNQLNLK